MKFSATITHFYNNIIEQLDKADFLSAEIMLIESNTLAIL
jgi:hypothetical protein